VHNLSPNEQTEELHLLHINQMAFQAIIGTIEHEYYEHNAFIGGVSFESMTNALGLHWVYIAIKEHQL
jgi:hypothetical protein